jgi:hypothetical protein
MFQDDVQLPKPGTNLGGSIMSDVICRNSGSHQRAITGPYLAYGFKHSPSTQQVEVILSSEASQTTSSEP